MSRRIIGTPDLMISTANQELVVEKPENWSVPIVYKSFSFMNTQACHIILNGNSRPDGTENRIFLREGQGINISEDDVDVSSFLVVQSGIEFNFIAKY